MLAPRALPEFDELQSGLAPAMPMDIDMTMGAEPTVEHLADGSIVVDLAPGAGYSDASEGAAPEDDFNRNLADDLATEAASLVIDLLDKIEYDETSRKGWLKGHREAMRLMGLIEDPEADPTLIEGASRLIFPLLAEAVIQFQARAVAELLPPEGPVKTTVIGKSTTEREEQATRVADHMNWQLTEDWPEYFENEDRLLMYLPLGGTAFKKVYNDPELDRPSSIFLQAHEVLVPWAAKSIATAERITHIQPMSERLLQARMKRGTYRNVTIAPPAQSEDNEFEDINKKAEGRDKAEHSDDAEHIVFETLVWANFEGDELAPSDGRLAPYIITTHKEGQTALAIRRNWRRDDPLYRRRQWYVAKHFWPGLGFYGYGLYHMLGGLSQAASGALRALLDSAEMANFQGGFKTRDIKGKVGGEVSLKKGKWIDVDLDAEDLKNGFYTPPFREPSTALFQLLGLIIETGRRLGSISEAMVGDAPNTGPVGTTVALIEQGAKVYSAIHRRLYTGLRAEFKIIAELNGEYVPEEGYPFEVAGAERTIMAADYDERVDVVPVADPTISSATQRIAMAQAQLQLAAQAPHLYDMREAHRRMHTALKTPDPDALMPDPADIARTDPVSENMMMLVGKPVRVFPDQDHASHLTVHMAFMQSFGDDKLIGQTLGPPMMAHVAEHLAQAYRLQMEQTMGAPLPLPDLHAQAGADVSPEMSPQVENAIAAAAARAAQGAKGGQGEGEEGPTPEQMAAQGEAQAKQMSGQAAMMRAQTDAERVKLEAMEAQRNADREDKLAEAKIFDTAVDVLVKYQGMGLTAQQGALMAQQQEEGFTDGQPGHGGRDPAKGKPAARPAPGGGLPARPRPQGNGNGPNQGG